MNLKKMLLLASMAMAAVAFAAPAAAQGNVQLKDENGKVLEVGAKVTATSTDLRTTVGEDRELTCKKVTLHYEVLVNGLTHVVLDPVPTPGEIDNAKAEECETHVEGVGSFPTHISNAGTKQLTINTWGTANVFSTFTAVTTTPLGQQHCEYHGSVHLTGTASGTDKVHIPGSPLTPTGAGCEPGEIHGTATLETTNGEGVNLHFVETP